MIAVMTFKAGELSVVEYGCNELLACVTGCGIGYAKGITAELDS